MLENISFEFPYFFILVPLFFLCSKFCPLRVESIIFPNLKILKIVKKRSFLLPTLKWITIITLITALSSPIIENNIVINKNNGYDIALILDTSGSMKEVGFDKENQNFDKFTAVQRIVAQFIDKRKNDNLALIVFGEFSFIASPLTYDKDILKDILIRLFIGIAGEKTAIIDSLIQTIKILSKSEAKSKIAILLTDGRNTAGKIPYNVATKILEKHKIKIYTIGIGTDRDYDKRLLVDIANKSGGKFFSAQNSEVLNDIYEEIDKLEKSEIKSDKFIKKDYLFIYPLFIAFISLILFGFIKK